MSACAADRLRERQRRAVAAGAVTLRAGTLDPARFLPGQDVSAYVAPVALLGVPPHCDLHHGAPAGPLDTIVVVDRLWELISQMNASQGSLAASIASDDAPLAAQVAAELRAFAVGINRTRSWDDLNEHRGGLGMSWSGAFAGGAGSVRAVTTARPGAHPPGNHPHGVVMPGDHRRVLGAAGGG